MSPAETGSGSKKEKNHQGISKRIQHVLILCIQLRSPRSSLVKLAVKAALMIAQFPVLHTGTNSKTVSTAPVPTGVT